MFVFVFFILLGIFLSLRIGATFASNPLPKSKKINEGGIKPEFFGTWCKCDDAPACGHHLKETLRGKVLRG